MPEINRRHFLYGSLGLAGAVALGACSSDGGGSDGGSAATAGPPKTLADALAAPGTAGLVDEARYQQRANAYLALATEELNAGDPTSIAAHLLRAGREPDFTWDPAAVTVDGLADTWTQIDTLQDTRDFRLMYLHWVYAHGRGDTDTTRLDPSVLDAIEQRLVGNRYRYNDPLPADGQVDEQWFWSENHIVIGLVNEYLAGQQFPDQTFTVTGKTGREHLERSKPAILEWIAERARYGFFEWHSNVYMLKNFSPLITLAELADDPELVRAAGMALDLALFDMAAHTHAGTFTASRGRTYKKDKTKALYEDTFSTNKFLFDDTTYDYTSKSDNGATYLAAATRYRPPQVVVDVATAPAPGVVRERHGIFVDGADPVTPHPKAPYGHDFEDPANLSFWWSQGAIGMWQVADISLSEAKKYQLFEAPAFEQIKLLSDLNGNDPQRIKVWEQANNAIVNFGHLREANTYGWRGDAVSLASVLDHRFGAMRDQIHSWQATIDAEALVFTTHPLTDPDESDDWSSDGKPGYWTGEASVPRVAQHEKTLVSIYQPAWDETTDELLWSVFPYRDLTHAFVPQDFFDEVVQTGNWTLLRRGDGYVGLWSWRTPTWRDYAGTGFATDGMTKPFDLVAEGGADNVWIVEVGEAADGSFADWQAAVTASEPQVEQGDGGFTVAWTSPSAGDIGFGSTAAFTVAGKEVAIDDHPRHQSAFGTVDHLATTYELASDGATLVLDFDAGTRTVGTA